MSGQAEAVKQKASEWGLSLQNVKQGVVYGIIVGVALLIIVPLWIIAKKTTGKAVEKAV